MQIISKQTNIDFMGGRKIALGVSVALILASVVSLFIKQLNFGVDFTGGVVVQVAYPQDTDIESVRATLEAAGYGSATVQHFGSERDILVRLAPEQSDEPKPGADQANDGTKVTVGEKVLVALQTAEPQVQLARVEFVGPQVGEELREAGSTAIIIVLILVFAFIAFRFQWKLGAGSIAALVHDVILVVGFFSVFGIDFDLNVLAAILAVIGYSLNDTIVVFDRIRENFKDVRKSTPEDMVNLSINQMLARTIVTGVTTLLVLLALYFVGGEAVKPFSMALIIGVIVGTYSSIYVASSIALRLKLTVDDLFPAEVEQAEIDALP